jgi:hypothetical protein
VAKTSENQNENSEIVRHSIPLCSLSDSVASGISKSHAIALPSRGG